MSAWVWAIGGAVVVWLLAREESPKKTSVTKLPEPKSPEPTKPPPDVTTSPPADAPPQTRGAFLPVTRIRRTGISVTEESLGWLQVEPQKFVAINEDLSNAPFTEYVFGSAVSQRPNADPFIVYRTTGIVSRVREEYSVYWGKLNTALKFEADLNARHFGKPVPFNRPWSLRAWLGQLSGRAPLRLVG